MSSIANGRSAVSLGRTRRQRADLLVRPLLLRFNPSVTPPVADAAVGACRDERTGARRRKTCPHLIRDAAPRRLVRYLYDVLGSSRSKNARKKSKRKSARKKTAEGARDENTLIASQRARPRFSPTDY